MVAAHGMRFLGFGFHFRAFRDALEGIFAIRSSSGLA
jgi:hypothetical protein